MTHENLKILAKGRGAKLLLELCEDIKRQVADIRTPMKIKSEIQNEVRLGTCDIIDMYLVEPLKQLSGVGDPPRAGDAKEYE